MAVHGLFNKFNDNNKSAYKIKYFLRNLRYFRVIEEELLNFNKF